jgi:1-acyl-sn-glycerol-3-phosphate acyltransferase
MSRVGDRMACRCLCWLAGKLVAGIEGRRESLQEDGLIVAMNHNQRLEALMLPALFAFLRQGRPIHFLADWHLTIVPILGSLLRRGGCIIVANKSHRLPLLNRWRPKTQAFQEALNRLQQGGAIALFPEGRMNRDPHRLLRGKGGAARLSRLSGRPILPVGIRFPSLKPGKGIGDWSAMTLHIGETIHPAAACSLEEQHQLLMSELARLSGKHWPYGGSRLEPSFEHALRGEGGENERS